jgi:predicted Zn finger-like uncharacterized protein
MWGFMKIICDACLAKYSIADEKIQGKSFKIRCKKCNHMIVVKLSEDHASHHVDEHELEVLARSADTWHVVLEGEEVGPLDLTAVTALVVEGRIDGDTLVWSEGFPDWEPLSKVAKRLQESNPAGSKAIPYRPDSSPRAVLSTRAGRSDRTFADGGRPPILTRYQVFISSTFEDLRTEREMVSWAILKCGHIPAGMENFTAAADRGWKIITRTINLSDYYVLLLAGRYGSLDATTGLSWTEREYNYAIERKIKVLTFMKDDSTISLTKADKSEEDRKRLQRFKEKLWDSHLCEKWKTSEDIAGLVPQALRRQIDEDQEEGELPPGWYRESTG